MPSKEMHLNMHNIYMMYLMALQILQVPALPPAYSCLPCLHRLWPALWRYTGKPLLHTIALYVFCPPRGCTGYLEPWGVNIHETTLLNENQFFSFPSSCSESWANFIRLLRRSTCVELTWPAAKANLVLPPWMVFSFPCFVLLFP